MFWLLVCNQLFIMNKCFPDSMACRVCSSIRTSPPSFLLSCLLQLPVARMLFLPIPVYLCWIGNLFFNRSYFQMFIDFRVSDVPGHIANSSENLILVKLFLWMMKFLAQQQCYKDYISGTKTGRLDGKYHYQL